MAKPGKHAFPTMATIRRRTAREIKAAVLAADTLKKQTAREMKEGARQAKKNGKKFKALLKKAAAERAAEKATYEKTGEVSPSTDVGEAMPPLQLDLNAPVPRRVRLQTAIANAYYRPDNPTAVTILRIKKALADLGNVADLLDDLYPI